MNHIEKWANDGVILINMSGVSFKEAQAGSDPTRTKKALSHIFTLTDENIDSNDPRYRKIEAALFPQGIQTENQRNDVKIVFEAAYYNAILVTRDGGSRTQPGGILGNRNKLNNIVQIMSDTEAVTFIRKKITERDEFNRLFAKKFREKLPIWTGED